MASKLPPGLNLSAKFEGPFFTKNPQLTFRQNVRVMMSELASEAQADVQTEIASHEGAMPNWTGWSRDNVKGRVENLSGKHWALTMVVSENSAGMSARDAIRTKAAGSSIEGRFHAFRHVASRIRGMKALMAADLTKGLE
jgi:hypothetical protein